MCAKPYKLISQLIELLLAFSAISSFPQLLRREADMVASYDIVPYLQHCYAWVVTNNAVHNYWKCYINVVTQTCSGFYWCICTLLWVLCTLGSHAYTLVKPLAAMLQYSNICTNILTWLVMYIDAYSYTYVINGDAHI